MSDSRGPAPDRSGQEPPAAELVRGIEAHRPPSRRRWIVPVLGAAVVAGAGASMAYAIFRADPTDDTPPPAAEGGLKVELGEVKGGDRIDPARPLRCFVEGKFIGELKVADCAKRNGVATQNLDVGLDEQGELAAVVALPEPVPAPEFAPGPSVPEPVGEPYIAPATPVSGPVGECVRHTGGEWRNLGDALERDTCVQMLFTGRCEEPGSASYGRWNGQTLRLVTGRVEIAPDGANFTTLMEQDASCMLP